MISVSDITSYMYCPRKLYLTKKKGLTTPPLFSIAYGRIFHEYLHKAAKFEPAIINLIKRIDQYEIEQLFIEQYRRFLDETINVNMIALKDANIDPDDILAKVTLNLETHAKSRAKKIFECAQEKGLTGNALWKQLEPKIITEFFIKSKKMRLKGKIDRMEVSGNRTVPFELKTGSAPRQGIWPAHHIQMAAYMMLLEEVYEEVPEGIICYLDHFSINKVKMNPFLREKVRKLIHEVHNLLDSEKIPECPEDNKCRKCLICDVCRNYN